MYGYDKVPEITPNEILQKITQEQIFEFILGKDFSYDKRYNSPFRKDDSPGCKFTVAKDGTIFFTDFAEVKGKTHRICWRMVMDYYNVSLSGAINILISKFNLSDDAKDYKEVEEKNLKYLKSTLEEKIRTPITYDKKAYDKRDVQYWSQFIITPRELLSDEVYSTDRIYVKGKVIKLCTPCYAIDFLHAVKLYQPYSIKYKWLCNTDQDDIGNIDNLPPTGEELVVAKSYKDHRVLRNNAVPYVIWLGSEAYIPSLHILQNLASRFRLITIFFDNDFKGIEYAMKLYEILSQIREGCVRMIHLPVLVSRKMTWKDPAEFISKEGRQDLITVLKQIKLL